MAQRKKKRMTKKQQAERERLTFAVMGLILVLFSFFGGLKLGFLGVMLANVFRFFVGDAYLFLAFILGVYGLIVAFSGKIPQVKRPKQMAGAIITILGVLLLLTALQYREVVHPRFILENFFDQLFGDIREAAVAANVGGGFFGALLFSGSYFLVAKIGSYILVGILILVGLIMAFNFPIFSFAQKVSDKSASVQDKLNDKKTRREEKRAEKAKQRELAEEKQRELAEAKRAEKENRVPISGMEDIRAQAELKRQNDVRAMTPGERLAKEEATVAEAEPEQTSLLIDHFQSKASPRQEEVRPVNAAANSADTDNADADDEKLEFEIPQEAEDRDYILPPTSLLDDQPPVDQSSEYNKIETNVKVLERTFASFGVDAKVVKASLGPAVTKFEIQPAVGVKVSKVVSLTDDIALALAAKDVRMEAPIPGKSLIGIEVPNSDVSTVWFKDIIAEKPPHPDHLLEVPLGKDISGNIVYADLAKMPHLLIAGSTGSGKSVAINTIITSLLMQAKPHEVKLMMVDPKMVELNVYNGIPHLLTPVVTNPKKAAQALQKVVQEMEQRYEKFAALSVRNIAGYNEVVITSNLENGTADPLMPLIVVIVDELADLMMVASNEVEDAIIRLAQMARAAGIHMILATQRPSVDVITGIIKANVPSRMAFAVSSGTDSRTIIDSNGAEKLLGRGDMLFLPMGENKPIRVQGAFISDHEVERVVKFVTDQREADYREDMMPTDDANANENSPASDVDELFDDAKNLVIEMQTASVSLLQRRFRIGYNRAARIVDELEAHGIVGPSEGSKPRKVLIEAEPEDYPEE